MLDRGVARPGPPPADVAGPPQPPAAPGRRRPAGRDVAPGPRRARPRAGPRGVRRRDAQRPGLPRLRGRRGGRRSTPPRCSAGCATPSARPVVRRRAQPRGAAAAHQVLGQRRRTGRPVGRGRAADRRAALRARRRARAHRRRARPRRDLPARGRRRHAGADDRVRPRVRAVRSRLGAADAPASRTTRSRTCWSTRRRTSRRCSGGWSAGAAGPRRGRSSATRRSRRGRCRRSRPRPAPTALEGKERHEFHLSTNYRNSSEIYEYAAAYAQRVGLDADLPDRGPLDGGRAAGGHRRSPTSSPRPARRCSTWPAG